MGTYKTIILAMLGTYRLTQLIVNESGPADVLCRFREDISFRAKISARWGKKRGFWPTLNGLITCEYCASVWAAALMAIFAMNAKRNRFAEWVLTWLGLAGAFCVAQEIKDAHDTL